MNTAATIVLKYMAVISAALLALMPFHAFLSIWATSFIGHYTAVRLWKEFLLLALCAGFIYVLVTQPKARNLIRRESLLWVIGVYVLFLILVGLIALLAGGVNLKALAYGILLDSRFLIFFVITWFVTSHHDLIVRYWRRLLLIPAVLVVGFATLQYSVLPADFLRHFGYGPDTIPPTATIDQKAAYQRVQSTLRGANPFGAYLVVILSALGVLVARLKRDGIKWAVLYIFSGLALVFTFSRSAWLGALASTALIIWWTIRTQKVRRLLLIGAAVSVGVFIVVAYILRDNDHFQNVFFHTNEHSTSLISSNYGHLNALLDGVTDIAFAPWGSGTGTAGPASVYNDRPTRIAENYYVQIGQEIGLVGLALFIVINILVGLRLWSARQETLPKILLVSFLGLMVVNLVSHAWTDDTLAYIWWGLAGAAIAASGAVEQDSMRS